MPRFGIKSILALTAFVAFGLLSLVHPMVALLVALPFVLSGLCILVSASAVRVRPETAFWVNFAIGAVSFLILTETIYSLVAFAAGYEPTELIREILSGAWKLMGHSREPFYFTHTGPGPDEVTTEVMCFAGALYVIIAAIWSAVLTLAAQYVFSRKAPS